MLPPRATTMRLNSPGTQATDDILLPGWQALQDPSTGKTYYANMNTGESIMDHHSRMEVMQPNTESLSRSLEEKCSIKSKMPMQIQLVSLRLFIHSNSTNPHSHLSPNNNSEWRRRPNINLNNFNLNSLYSHNKNKLWSTRKRSLVSCYHAK